MGTSHFPAQVRFSSRPPCLVLPPANVPNMNQLVTITPNRSSLAPGDSGRGTVEFDSHIRKYEASAVLQRVVRYLRIMCRHLTWKKLVNFFQIELDYRLARPVCRGKPWSAKIEPTNICNLQCPYCPREETPYGLG